MKTWAVAEYSLYVGKPLLDMLRSLQFAADEQAARALVQSGQVWLDGRALQDPDLVLKIRDVQPGSIFQVAGEAVQLIIWVDEE
ncbi:hypothetical protein V8J88_24290 [Massilia sp. W12]|uniref:hypothetical protein n=1 Tax=Massilia sp. W12 TaxID=3126507 RepID=UPI0030D56649